MSDEHFELIEGCVRPGIEQGCIVLETPKGNYSLHGKDDDSGYGVDKMEQGLLHLVWGKPGGVDHCIEGTVFQVHRWKSTRMRCVPDAQIFLNAQVVSTPSSQTRRQVASDPGQARMSRQERRFVLAHWRDPFSRQGPSVECAKWCSVTPWDKWCCGHTYKWKYLDVDLVLTVGCPENFDVQKALNECLTQAGIAAALAGILAAIATGGAALAAAIEGFRAVLVGCLAAKLSDAAMRLDQESQWTDWQ